MPEIKVVDRAFDPLTELNAYRQSIETGSCGANAIFIGTLRDFNNDAQVQSMTLEHYPGMTEKQLQRIADDAKRSWEIVDALIVHRVGYIRLGEAIVLTAAWAGHRDPAFAACRYMIEQLKSNAPFWKKEKLSGGERWVDKN